MLDASTTTDSPVLVCDTSIAATLTVKFLVIVDGGGGVVPPPPEGDEEPPPPPPPPQPASTELRKTQPQICFI